MSDSSMDTLTFISEIVKALAWPATVLAAIYIFRHSLESLIPRIEKLRHKDTEIDFSRQVEELKSEVPASLKPDRLPQPEKQQFESELNRLRDLTELSPRSAVIEAFRILEASALAAVSKHFPGLGWKGFLSQSEIAQVLNEKGLFTKEDENFYMSIRSFRNQAAHSGEFALSSKAVCGYAEIALALAYSLRAK